MQYACPIQVFERTKVGAFAASLENTKPIQRFLSAGANMELLTQFELKGRERFVATQEGFWLLCFDREHDELVKRIGLLAQLAAENVGAVEPPKRLLESAWRIVSSRSTKASGTGHSVCGTPRSDILCPKCSQPAQPIARIHLADKPLGQNPWPDAALSFFRCLRDDCEDWSAQFFVAKQTRPPAQCISVELEPEPATSSGKNRLGGDPRWIQSPEIPECPKCGKIMHFALQMDGCGSLSFGDAGMLYAFACPACKVTATVIQSH